MLRKSILCISSRQFSRTVNYIHEHILTKINQFINIPFLQHTPLNPSILYTTLRAPRANTFSKHFDKNIFQTLPRVQIVALHAFQIFFNERQRTILFFVF